MAISFLNVVKSQTGCTSGDCANGYGTYMFSNGNKYIGDFKNSSFNGKGTYYYANSTKYEGNFADNKRNGEGTFYYANGSIYKGNWKDDNINGFGIYSFASGNKYEGNFVDGNRNGEGTFCYSNGSTYKGNWKDDKINGFGIFNFANGDKYEDNYIDGKRNGEGTFYYVNGTIKKGLWKDDGYVGASSDEKQTKADKSKDNNLPKCVDSRDGNTYKTVKIGDQVWMAENLKYKTSTGSYCYNNDEKNCNKYGRLYTSEAAKDVCPKGWHLSSAEEWGKIESAIGTSTMFGYVNVGKQLKLGGASGFDALLGGEYFGKSEKFLNLDSSAYFISSTTEFAPTWEGDEIWWVKTYCISGDSFLKSSSSLAEKNAFSVRCIKD